MLKSFETDRLLLKELTSDHEADYAKGFVDYEIIRHMVARVPWPYPDGGVKEFFDTQVFPFQGKTLWQWGIFLKERPEVLVGSITLRQSDVDNRGFWLAKPYSGRGYMTEALAPLTKHAFEDLGFDILRFSNAQGNERSRRIKEKAGARFVELKETKSVDPDYTHSEHWELTKEDWLKEH